MRFALVACLVLGCSSPAPHDEDPSKGYTRDSSIAETDDDAPGPVFDTAHDAALPDTAPAIDSTPDAPPVDTAPPDTTPPVCYPLDKVAACVPVAACSTCPGGACGTRPDGCGGDVACDPCPVTSKCIALPSVAPYCGCTRVIGPLCLDNSGAYAGEWKCPPDAAPLHPLAKKEYKSDSTASYWCIPAGL